MLSVDLLHWGADLGTGLGWPCGSACALPRELRAAIQGIHDAALESTADYLLLWRLERALPPMDVLEKIIASGVDLAHAGAHSGEASLLFDLDLMIHDWSMIAVPRDRATNCWHGSMDACLVRRELIVAMGGLDEAFTNIGAAGLEFIYRCYRGGALVEQRPDLVARTALINTADTAASASAKFGGGSQLAAAEDFAVFALRHFGLRWAQYGSLRRGLPRLRLLQEWRVLQRARRACSLHTMPGACGPVWYGGQVPGIGELRGHSVTVLIPTLGRYPYIPGALESMRRQSCPPQQVIVVDQNPVEMRRPDLYEGYDDLHLQVIYQDERGQSRSRNAGLAAATGKYILLFEDDALAADDLIEQHLGMLLGGRFDVSSGVVFPPPPTNYQLPEQNRYPRLSQMFSTGNAMLSLDLAHRLGGFDGNYDFGPGADTDFGTRLYLAGKRIVHNPAATMIHFKAPMGGLRVHGVVKYNTDAGWLAPFPPVTQSYYGLRYLSARQQRERVLLQFVTSKFPIAMRRSGPWRERLASLVVFVLGFALLPIKSMRSAKAAQRALAGGILTASFAAPPELVLTGQSLAGETSPPIAPSPMGKEA